MFFKDRREVLSQELEKVKIKKRALDDLSRSDRISLEVYQYLDEDLSETLTLIEERLRRLDMEASSRKEDLEQQVSMLERLLAILESEHAIDAIKEEEYRSNYECLMLGIEASKKEIEGISGAPTPSPQKKLIEEKAVTEQILSEETIETDEGENLRFQGDELQEPTGLVSLEKVEDEDAAVSGAPLLKDHEIDEWNGDNNGSEIHCMNPWNKECSNTDIEVYIYYNNERFPICHVCWEKLADKELDW